MRTGLFRFGGTTFDFSESHVERIIATGSKTKRECDHGWQIIVECLTWTWNVTSRRRPRPRQKRMCPVRVCPTVYACSLPCTCSCPVGKRVYWLIASFLPSARLPIGSAINRYALGTRPLDIRRKHFALYATLQRIYVDMYTYTLRPTTLLNDHLFRLESGRGYGMRLVRSLARNRRCFVTWIIISGRINRSLSGRFMKRANFGPDSGIHGKL